jgi:hypothetical protein
VLAAKLAEIVGSVAGGVADLAGHGADLGGEVGDGEAAGSDGQRKGGGEHGPALKRDLNVNDCDCRNVMHSWALSGLSPASHYLDLGAAGSVLHFAAKAMPSTGPAPNGLALRRDVIM